MYRFRLAHCLSVDPTPNTIKVLANLLSCQTTVPYLQTASLQYQFRIYSPVSERNRHIFHDSFPKFLRQYRRTAGWSTPSPRHDSDVEDGAEQEYVVYLCRREGCCADCHCVGEAAHECVSEEALVHLKSYKYSSVDKSFISNYILKHYVRCGREEMGREKKVC